MNPSLLASIEAEVRCNIKRMRSHPCIVLWCGNNEDHMFAELHKLEYDRLHMKPENWLKSNWPARYYYEKLMPDVCAELVLRTPYHPSSPWGGDWSNDPTVGDMHSWRVWMADQIQARYQRYPGLSGRFVSEFGMKSYPCLRSLAQCISDPTERHPQSKTLDGWHMASADQRTLAMYLNENFRHGVGLEAYVYATQVLQAEAMDYAVRGFRRGWKGQGKEECAGNLIWQLNDCFPAVSWSLVDACERKKLAWYTVKRAYESRTVGVERFETVKRANEFTDIDVVTTAGVRVWASNLTLVQWDIDLDITWVEVGGKVLEHLCVPVRLDPNLSVDLHEEVLPESATPLVESAKLLHDQQVIARFVDWPQPLRHLDLAHNAVAVVVHGKQISIRVERAVEALELFVRDGDVDFSDNCFDLVPGDGRIIQVHGLGEGTIERRHLGSSMV